MRFHTQTAGVSLTAQQPEVNIVRTALEALSAVLGGTQSLHTNSFDEALALADRERGADRPAHAAGDRARDRRRQHDRSARRLLLRRGPDEPARGRGLRLLRPDPEARRRHPGDQGELLPARDRRGVVRYQSEVEAKQRIIVGVNRYELEDEPAIELLRVDPALEQKQIDNVEAVRARRDSAEVEAALARLKEAAAGEGTNLMPLIVDASRAYVTMGEMCDALREVWGVWRETPVF